METSAIVVMVICIVIVLFIIVTVFKTMYTVRTYTAGVVERFGNLFRKEKEKPKLEQEPPPAHAAASKGEHP